MSVRKSFRTNVIDMLGLRRRHDPSKPETYRVKGVDIIVADVQTSIAPLIVRELRNNSYPFDKVQFAPGDVAIDIGGHIGIVSLYLALKYPFLKIYAYEPTPINYRYFSRNIELNGVTNITLENVAVTSDRRNLEMIVNLENTGGATSNLSDMTLKGHERHTASSITLDDVLFQNAITKCKLLKIDCEGSEHEILRSTEALGRIEWITGEFHINRRLEAQGYSIEGLVRYLQTQVSPQRISYHTCRMAE